MATGAAALGVLGGTFDPIHYGHLRLALEVAQQVGLTEVRFIPAGRPWHRSPPRAAASHRLAMVRLAVSDNPLFRVDEREVVAESPGYTVETLTALRRELGFERPVCLLLGADAFQGLHTWHRWQELFGLAHVVVAQRPGCSPVGAALAPDLAAQFSARQITDPAVLLREPAGRIHVQTITALDISASRIRADLAAGRDPRYLLPDSVLAYIGRHRLYD
jgi:nicotinate-nucleotide adenylyltransferase